MRGAAWSTVSIVMVSAVAAGAPLPSEADLALAHPGCSRLLGDEVAVGMVGFYVFTEFTPSCVVVSSGGAVTWTSKDTSPHILHDPASLPEGCFRAQYILGSNGMGPGDRIRVTFIYDGQHLWRSANGFVVNCDDALDLSSTPDVAVVRYRCMLHPPLSPPATILVERV